MNVKSEEEGGKRGENRRGQTDRPKGYICLQVTVS